MSVEKIRASLVILPVSLYIVSLGTGWLRNLLAAIAILVFLLVICALLYVHCVPLTSAPVRDGDGNPRFR